MQTSLPAFLSPDSMKRTAETPSLGTCASLGSPFIHHHCTGCVSTQWKHLPYPSPPLQPLERLASAKAFVQSVNALSEGATKTKTGEDTVYHITLGGFSCPHAEVRAIYTPTVSVCVGLCGCWCFMLCYLLSFSHSPLHLKLVFSPFPSFKTELASSTAQPPRCTHDPTTPVLAFWSKRGNSKCSEGPPAGE